MAEPNQPPDERDALPPEDKGDPSPDPKSAPPSPQPKQKRSEEDHIQRLNKEAQDRRLEAVELRKLVETQQAAITKAAADIAAIAGKAEQADKDRQAAELKAQKVRIGVANGLPVSLAERLNGATPEEIEADAKALAKDVPRPSARTALGYAGETPPISDGKALYERTQGQGPSPFTPAMNSAKGGGIVNSEQ